MTEPKTTLSAFIRNMPDASVAAVIAKGQEQGLTISDALVRKVRSRPAPTRGRGRPRGSKRAPERAAPRQSAPPPVLLRRASKPKRGRSPANDAAEHERALARIVLALGMVRTQDALDRIAKKIAAIIG